MPDTDVDPASLRSKVIDSANSPCRQCPWRLSNQGTGTPGGWYSKKNRTRLWAGLRRGESMTCHPTDPAFNDAELKAQGYAGFRPAPVGATTRECAGAMIVVQREFDLMQREYDHDFSAYRRGRPNGLMRDGVLAILERAMFGGVFARTIRMLNLVDSDVGHPDLPWSPPDRSDDTPDGTGHDGTTPTLSTRDDPGPA